MSDKLLPIDRVAELDNVGIIRIEDFDEYSNTTDENKIWYLMFEMRKYQDTILVHPLAMQKIIVRQEHYFAKGEEFYETKKLATPYEGGYGAAIHDYVLWDIKGKISIADRSAVSKDAAKVRDIYANTRKGSVHAFPIDKKGRNITPQLDDDYETHYRHGGFDVYTQYNDQDMLNIPEAYKDWAVHLTPQGKKEINAACESLKKNGEKMLERMRRYSKTSYETFLLSFIELADRFFWAIYLESPRQDKYSLNINTKTKKFTVEDKNPSFIAPILDKSKKTTQLLGIVHIENPRRIQRRL